MSKQGQLSLIPVQRLGNQAYNCKMDYFQLGVESYPGLQCFCFALLCDWSRKLATLCQQIR